MQYVIKDKDGVEHGPVDETTLIKWAAERRIDSQTPVRPTLVNNWHNAADMDFLKAHVLDPVADKKSGGGMFGSVSELFTKGRDQANSASGYLQRRAAVKAKLPTRFMAFLFDALIFFIIGLLILGYLIGSVVSDSVKNMPDNELAASDCLIDGKEYALRMLKIQKADEYSAYQQEQAKLKAKEDADAAKREAARNRTEYTPAPEPTPEEKNKPAEQRKMGRESGFSEFGTGGGGPVMVKPKEEEVENKVPEKAFMPEFEVADNNKATAPPSKKADFRTGYFRGSTWTVAGTGDKYVCLANGYEEYHADPTKNVGYGVWCKVSDLSSQITKTVVIIAVLVLIYYTIAIGYFAQTFGMWFWGLFVARPGKREPHEAFFFRSFLFAFFMLIFGIFTPLMIFICGAGIQDLLAGVRVYHVAGKAVM